MRESDGLAMSSRNVNLSEKVRSEARVIYEGMETARQYFEDCKYEERGIQGVLCKFEIRKTSINNRRDLHIQFIC